MAQLPSDENLAKERSGSVGFNNVVCDVVSFQQQLLMHLFRLSTPWSEQVQSHLSINKLFMLQDDHHKSKTNSKQRHL